MRQPDRRRCSASDTSRSSTIVAAPAFNNAATAAGSAERSRRRQQMNYLFELLDLGGQIRDHRHSIAIVLALQNPNGLVGLRLPLLQLGALGFVAGKTLVPDL